MDATRCTKVSKRTLTKIETILSCVSANVDFDQFHYVMGLVWIETYGTVAGFELLNEWAKKGDGDIIPTGQALWDCWSMYDDDSQRYFGMCKLLALAEKPKKKHRK